MVDGSLCRAALAALGSEDEEVAGALLPFLGAYVAKVKAGLKRGGALAQVRALLARLSTHPPWMCCRRRWCLRVLAARRMTRLMHGGPAAAVQLPSDAHMPEQRDRQTGSL